MLNLRREKRLAGEPASVLLPQVDPTPWANPFLTPDNIRRFRRYSEHVWEVALAQPASRPLDCAFAVNMAQNMYRWSKLAAKHGAAPTLYLNPQDTSALSRPEWEEFDGAWTDVIDGPGFLREHSEATAQGRWIEAPNHGAELLTAYQVNDNSGWRAVAQSMLGSISPERALEAFPTRAAAVLRARAPSVRHWSLLALEGMYPYFGWAEMLAQHEVTYIASTPFPAYASGKPYCVCAVGGDLQFDCGRADDWGRAMRTSFAGAHLLLASNPHALGHCRRFGFENAVYLPYPIDTDDYAPGVGRSRAEWRARFGGDVFVLSTSRLDSGVKGQSDELFRMLVDVSQSRPNVRFIFLGWGKDADAFRARVQQIGAADRIIVLPPVGKRRLLDYYRSCDIVLDQFVYGYFGATALEASAVGKPVVMKLRTDQYEPLYAGDVAPIDPADTVPQIEDTLFALIDCAERREQRGEALRAWLVRNHGGARTGPLLTALLRLTANRVAVRRRWDNPLRDRLSNAERAYQQRCQQQAQPSTSSN